MDEDNHNVETLKRQMDDLIQLGQERAAAVAALLKRDAAAGLRVPGEETRALAKAVDEVSGQIHSAMTRLMDAAGIDEHTLQAYEASLSEGREELLWRHELSDVQVTEEAREGLASALEALLRRIDPAWLAAQEAKYTRLGEDYRTEPLRLVGGLRVAQPAGTRAQRYAEMLLLTRDFVEGRDDVDFWALPLAVAEVKRLGTQLDEIAALGSVAEDKLRCLPLMDDQAVAASTYELLVGATAVRRGQVVEMLAERGGVKTPDFRVHGLPLPTVMECKRRIGLSAYVQKEADAVAGLYHAARPLLQGDVAGWMLEVEFVEEIANVAPETFVNSVREVVGRASLGTAELSMPWGSLRVVALLPEVDLAETRLYSPGMLRSVFGWTADTTDWDGLICEVANAPRLRVSRAIRPMCLKWRSVAPTAAEKRARGVTSLFGDAAQQIPPGEVGIIHIAYPEFARAAVADARTRDILDNDWYHSPFVRIPLVYVARLYPYPLDNGDPDLVENVMRLVAAYAPSSMPDDFPNRVFTT